MGSGEKEGRKKERVREGGRDERGLVTHKRSVLRVDCGLLSLLQFGSTLKTRPPTRIKENWASCVLEIPGRLHGGGETGAKG